jgi:mRNA-degrading endonuclease YafQ of YafQ-DinJ toxin-antitoxin module
MNNKLPEYDPWTGDRNPLLDSEDVRKEEFGKFGKSSSHAARNEEATFTPEDGVEMILEFLADELPITSRYIDQKLVYEWITKRYNV